MVVTEWPFSCGVNIISIRVKFCKKSLNSQMSDPENPLENQGSIEIYKRD